MAELYDWNISAGSNTSAPPNGFPENMNYREVNDSGREVMAVLARWLTSIKGATLSTGTQPAYELVSGLSISVYAAGQLFAFKAHATSTGNVTLDVDDVGAGNVVDSYGNQLGSGDIRQNGVYLVVRTSGGVFCVLGHLAAASIIAATGNNLNETAITTTGSSNAYVATTGLSLSSITTGQIIALIPNFSNTGAATLDVDGTGAVALEDFNSAALVSGDITSGEAIFAWYTGSEWRIFAGIPIDLASQVSGALPLTNGGTGQVTGAAGLSALIGSASTVAAAPSDLVGIQDASDSNNGKKVLVSTLGVGKQTIWVPASAMKPNQPSSDEFTASSTRFDYLAFGPSSSEDANFLVAMPQGWDAGSISYKVYWLHPSTTTNFATVWQMFAKPYGNDDAVDGSSFASLGTVVDTGGTTSDLYISTETTAAAVTGAAKGDLLDLIIRRVGADGADTLAVDAYLLGVQILYTTDANTDD